MAKTLKGILNKTRWTGKEVGLAILYRQELGKQGKQDIVTDDLIAEMTASLISDHEREICNTYIDTNNFLNDTARLFRGTYNSQVRNGFAELTQALGDLFAENLNIKRECSRPLTITENAYNVLKSTARGLQNCKAYSFYDIFCCTLSYFIGKCKAGGAEELPDSIIDAIREGAELEVKNPRAIKCYLKKLGLLDNANSSADMTFKEKQAYIISLTGASPENVKAELKQRVKEYYKGDTAALMEFIDVSYNDSISPALYNELDADELTEEIYKAYIDQTAAELSAFESVDEKPHRMDALYKCLEIYTDECKDGTPERQRLKEFKADYPELYQATAAYMAEYRPELAELKPNQLFKGLLYLDDLQEYPPHKVIFDRNELAGIFKDVTLTDYILHRQALNGTALLSIGAYSDKLNEQSDGLLLPDLGITGYYKTTYKEIAKRSSYEFKKLSAYRYNIDTGLAHLYAYKRYLQVLFEVLDIGFFNTAYPDTDALEELARQYNHILYHVYADIRNTKAETLKRRKIIKEALQPIDPSKYLPSEEALEKEREHIKALYGTSDFKKYMRDVVWTIHHIAEMTGG